mmetsp:Transcript_18644/g.47611  ORF Transcript_18644/g.47611 Transcript_18644/m.47611 type:complete len:142 (-) Transcript_18644:388-813(-)
MDESDWGTLLAARYADGSSEVRQERAHVDQLVASGAAAAVAAEPVPNFDFDAEAMESAGLAAAVAFRKQTKVDGQASSKTQRAITSAAATVTQAVEALRARHDPSDAGASSFAMPALEGEGQACATCRRVAPVIAELPCLH